MAAPTDESVPIEFSESSTKRRAHKKLHDIGISQFKRQGVVHHFQPNSAAGQFNRQKAEQRLEAWLRSGPSSTPADASQEKAKGRKKAKNGVKDKKNADVTTPPTADANVDRTQMKYEKTLEEHGQAQKQSQHQASTAVKPPTRNAVRTITVARHVKATSGTWGHRVVESAKKAASKASTTTYATTPINVDVLSDGELEATTKTAPKLPSPKPTISHATVQPKKPSLKTVRKTPVKVQVPKKSQGPMWSDSSQDDQDDQDDIDDLIHPSKSAASSTKTPRNRTTKNSSADKSSRTGSKAGQAQSTPQKRQVRFAATAGSDLGTESVNRDDSRQKPKPMKKTTSKTAPKENANSTTTTTTTKTFQVKSQSPSQPTDTSDPGELSDDEDSELQAIHGRAATLLLALATPESSSVPSSTSKDRHTPRKGVAIPPMPMPVPMAKSARKTEINNDNDMNNAAPAIKQAKTSAGTTITKKDLPARKNGVAGPPKPKRARDTEIDNDMNDTAPPSKKTKTSAGSISPEKESPVRKKGVATKVKAKRAKPQF